MFITFEGIDGVGKSTQARRLADALRTGNRDVVLTREPGGATGAEDIRRLLVEGEPGRWSAETEILLFFAARRDHVERTIRPALDRGAWVICDRFTDSTRAYQGDGPLRGKVDLLHETFIGIDPGLTLILDMDPDVSLDRTKGREDLAEDRFEQKGLSFQHALRRAFHQIAEAEPGRCALVSADGDPDAVSDAVMDVLVRRGLA